MKKRFLLPVLSVFAGLCHAQKYPVTQAVRTSSPITIDGVINEETWKTAPLITNLMEMRPTPGRTEATGNRTEVYLLYDNSAVYFGGTLYEASRDSISQQLAGRDNIGVNDFVGVVFDTYQDKINGLGFYVTPLNEQFDIKYAIGINNGEDITWNAVYTSAVTQTDKGWSFEMRIPYSALRFSKAPVQNWNIQIVRRRNKSGQQFSWSPIDPTMFGFMNQAGTWEGLKDIQPPLRLSFSPYFSTYLTKNPLTDNKWHSSVNGGMDLKYGISDAFTMDMTLIPDFGQVQSDNQVLNLSPFEIRFNENRPFFNEGVELFNKGNLFYSRRIGGTPIHYGLPYSLGDSVVENPAESKLINATKISGRTKKKLGLGFFNAITKPQHATMVDQNGKKYEIETNPLTNYNVLVVEQGLKNNSRVTLINTNVMRSGHDYDANVTSLDWDLYDNNVNWNFWGQVNQSRLYDLPGIKSSENGLLYNLFIGQFKGRFNWEVHRFFTDDKYQQGDMGFFTNNNYVTHGFYAGYKWVRPRAFYNNIFLNFNGNYSELYKPRKYQDFRINGNVNGQFKNLWTFLIQADWRPRSNDFYEPRLWGWTFDRPANWMKGFRVTTNRAKKYSTSFQLFQRTFSRYKTSNIEGLLSNLYRFSDKFNVEVSHYVFFGKNDYGFAYTTPAQDSVITGLRNRRTSENILNVKYNFNNKMGLTFRLRHYWSKADYFRFFNLEKEGGVTPVLNPSRNPDVNRNLFNIDMNYSWQIAPGSFVNVNWKTSSDMQDKLVDRQYFDNFSATLDYPQFQSFSVKLIYYLDYLDLKKK
jgi:hypothetical protein